MTGSDHGAPEAFVDALRSLRAARVPRAVTLEEVDGPRYVAPWTAELRGVVSQVGADASSGARATTGRFVVLHDPEGQEAWEGDFRIVILVRAHLDAVVYDDPVLAAVTWDWLDEALQTAGAGERARAGAVTRVRTERFGRIGTPGESGQPADESDLELRASWTPESTDLAAHLAAWADVMRALSGLEPDRPGVSVLRQQVAS